MQVIKQIGVVSLGKIMGVSGFLISLVVCVPWGLLVMLLGIVGGAGAAGDDAGIAGGMFASGIGGGLFVMIGFPLLAGIMYFVFGLIYGLILNLVFGLAGGLEVQIENVNRY